METPDISHLTSSDYEHVYEPAEDSFLLLDALEKDLDFIRSRDFGVIVELGPGSGVIVTALAKHTRAFCMGVDISPFACQISHRTAKRNGVRVDLVNMDLLGGFRDHSIDMLLFNPPYVPTRVDESEDFEAEVKSSSQSIVGTWAGGLGGREIVDKLLRDVGRVLAPGGVFYLLLLKENDPKGVLEETRKLGFRGCIFMERRIIGEHLFVLKLQKP